MELLGFSSFLPFLGGYQLALHGFVLALCYLWIYKKSPLQIPPPRPLSLYWVFLVYIAFRTLSDFPLSPRTFQYLLSPAVLTLLLFLPFPPRAPKDEKMLLIGIGIAGLWILVYSHYFEGYVSLNVKNLAILWNMSVLMMLWLRPSRILLAGAAFGLNFFLSNRTALLGFSLSYVALCLTKRYPRFALFGLIAGTIAYGGLSFLYFGPFFQSRLTSFCAETWPTFFERLVLWAEVKKLIATSPWNGVGPLTLSALIRRPLTYFYRGREIMASLRHPHNLFLELRASFGLIGLALAGAAGLQTLLRLYFQRAHSETSLWVALITYSLIMMTTFLSFFRDAWFFAGIGLVVLTSRAFFRPPQKLA